MLLKQLGCIRVLRAAAAAAAASLNDKCTVSGGIKTSARFSQGMSASFPHKLLAPDARAAAAPHSKQTHTPQIKNVNYLLIASHRHTHSPTIHPKNTQTIHRDTTLPHNSNAIAHRRTFANQPTNKTNKHDIQIQFLKHITYN